MSYKSKYTGTQIDSQLDLVTTNAGLITALQLTEIVRHSFAGAPSFANLETEFATEDAGLTWLWDNTSSSKAYLIYKYSQTQYNVIELTAVTS